VGQDENACFEIPSRQAVIQDMEDEPLVPMVDRIELFVLDRFDPDHRGVRAQPRLTGQSNDRRTVVEDIE